MPYDAFTFPQWNAPSHTAAKGSPKLSAGASAFRPETGAKGPSPIRVLARNSTADDGPTIVSSPTLAGGKAKTGGKTASQQPIGTRNGKILPARPRVYFTTDVGPGVNFLGGHYVKLEHVSASQIDSDLKYLSAEVSRPILHHHAIFTNRPLQYGWDRKLRGSKAPPPNKDQKFLTLFYCFDDVEDAKRSVEEVELVNAQMSGGFITQAEYAGAPSTHGTQDATSFYDGQLVWVATFDGLTSEFNAGGAADAVVELAQRFGKVYVFAEIQTATYPHLEFRCEYNKISAAKTALEKATKQSPIIVGVSLLFTIAPGSCTDMTAELVGLRQGDAQLHHSSDECF